MDFGTRIMMADITRFSLLLAMIKV